MECYLMTIPCVSSGTLGKKITMEAQLMKKKKKNMQLLEKSIPESLASRHRSLRPQDTGVPGPDSFHTRFSGLADNLEFPSHPNVCLTLSTGVRILSAAHRRLRTTIS
jgi:hypothetical protein